MQFLVSLVQMVPATKGPLAENPGECVPLFGFWGGLHQIKSFHQY